jgi:hypothetical protein
MMHEEEILSIGRKRGGALMSVIAVELGAAGVHVEGDCPFAVALPEADARGGKNPGFPPSRTDALSLKNVIPIAEVDSISVPEYEMIPDITADL